MSRVDQIADYLASTSEVAARINQSRDVGSAATARAFSKALRDPERVRRLIDGLIPAELLADQQAQDNRVPA